MRNYRHLSLVEREKIFAFRTAKLSFREIARKLDRDVSTVSREWKRNTRYGNKYLPILAQKRSDRVSLCQRYKAPLKGPFVFLYIRRGLRLGHWSPEMIAGRLRLEYPNYSIDDETIYRYIYGKRQRREKLWRYLSRHRRRRFKLDGRKVRLKGRIRKAVPISLRPSEANERMIIGHWESDNMEGKRSDKTTVSVTVERSSRVVRIQKLINHRSNTKIHALTEQFRKQEPILCRSLTLDRGPENSSHQLFTRRTAVPVFFCEPYHSWEKGTVENTIGRIRRYFPKGESVDKLTQEDLNKVEELLNSLPRKCLGFLTPNEYLRRSLAES